MYEYKIKSLNKVVDGDTVDITVDLGFGVFMDQRIRLNGVNTPESRTKDKEEKKKGLAAKSFVEFQLSSLEDVILKTFKDRPGKYGRILGDFIIHGKSLVAQIIEHGYGKPYSGGKR